jgi:hypothetical protein
MHRIRPRAATGQRNSGVGTSKPTCSPGAGCGCRADGAADAQRRRRRPNHGLDYLYEAFGRVTALPRGLTNTFCANNLVATQQLGAMGCRLGAYPAHDGGVSGKLRLRTSVGRRPLATPHKAVDVVER